MASQAGSLRCRRDFADAGYQRRHRNSGAKQMYFVGVSAWIIQDGNYGDFHAGDFAKFALEFSPHETEVSPIDFEGRTILSGYYYRGPRTPSEL